MKFFDPDSSFMQMLNTVTDLIVLNFVAFICCIPIFTIGASMTALHYSVLKIVRSEDGYVVKGFFKSFKQNFRQATIIWLIFLLAFILVFGDLFILNNSTIAYASELKIVVMAAGVLVLLAFVYVFPLLAKFDNTVFRTIKNAFGMSIIRFPRTLIIIAVNCVPLLLVYFQAKLAPLILLFGISVPALVTACLYSRTFEKFENQIKEAGEPKAEPAEGEEGAAEMIETADPENEVQEEQEVLPVADGNMENNAEAVENDNV